VDRSRSSGGMFPGSVGKRLEMQDSIWFIAVESVEKGRGTG
jgi:hypothetical protein